MIKPFKLYSLLALPLALAGCATRSPSSFADVEQTVKERTRQDIRWPTTREEMARTDALVTDLLKSPLTPETVVQVALLNNRSLRATLEEIGISQSEIVQAGLLRNPSFAASVRFPDRPPSGANSEFSLAGDVMDLLLMPLRKRIATVQYEQTKLRVSHEILQMAAEAKTLYFTAQARQQLLERLRTVTEVNEAAADLSQRQHKAGNISELELGSQQGALHQSQLEVFKAEAQLKADRERINRLLGLSDKNTEWKLEGALPTLPEKEVEMEHLEKLALFGRLDLFAAEKEADLAGKALALRTKTRFLPAAIRLGIDTEHDASHTQLTGPTLDLEIPLFDQGQGAIAKLQAQHRQALWKVEALANDIRSEVRQARDAMLAARQLTEFYSKTYLPQQIRIVNETLVQYNAMQKSPYDVMAAKERELHAEREYTEAWRDYWIARTELEKSLGSTFTTAPGAVVNATRPTARGTEKPNLETAQPHEHK